MDDGKRDLIMAWLVKAKTDLNSALKLASGNDPYLDTAIYHCQQAAEKAIKAVLIFHDHRFKKIHDLEALIELAVEHDSDFSDWLEIGKELTPYATDYRYPGDITDEPDKEEFDKAYLSAKKINIFVISKLPMSTIP